MITSGTNLKRDLLTLFSLPPRRLRMLRELARCPSEPRAGDGGFQGAVECAPLASPISINAAAWTMTFQLRLADVTGHCQWGRTCIHSGHGCIGQVANRARRCPNIRRRTALVRLRKRPVPAKSGCRATTLT